MIIKVLKEVRARYEGNTGEKGVGVSMLIVKYLFSRTAAINVTEHSLGLLSSIHISGYESLDLSPRTIRARRSS